MKEKSKWKPEILAFANNSATVINPNVPKIINNSNEPHSFLISSLQPLSNQSENQIVCQHESVLNSSTENFFDKQQNEVDYQTVSNNLNRNEYLKDANLNSDSSQNLNHNQRRKFSLEEDIKLSRAIALQGPRKWDQIALSLPGRTGRQCRDRFHNYLNPSLTNGPWTREEDKLLEQKVYELGQHWNKIVRFFRGRSANNIKNRWYTYICKQKQSQYKPLSYKNINKNKQKVVGQNDGSIFCNDRAVISSENKNVNNIPLNNYGIIQNNINSVVSGQTKNDFERAGKSTKKNFDDIEKNLKRDLLSPKNKNDTKIFFPPISPPNNARFLPLNQGMFSFLS